MLTRRHFLTTLGAVAAGAGCRRPDATGPDPFPSEALDVTAFGASGDGQTDDTRAIQNAIEAAPGAGGTVWIPPGEYLIDPRVGLRPLNGLRLTLADGAVLRGMPSAASTQAIVQLLGTSDVEINGGRIIGGRSDNHFRTCQRAFGIQVAGASAISLFGMTIDDCWTDAVYLSGRNTSSGFMVTRDVRIADCVMRNNRRQGISVVAGQRIDITHCEVSDTKGAAPACGIDIEPNVDRQISDVSVRQCTLLRNAGWGIQLAGHNGDLRRVIVDGNVTAENKAGGLALIGAKATTIKFNTLGESSATALSIDVASEDFEIQGNAYPGNGKIIMNAAAHARRTEEERARNRAANRCT